MTESNHLIIQIGAVCALMLALFNIFNGKARTGMEFSKHPVVFCFTQGILLELAFLGADNKISALNIEVLQYFLIVLFIATAVVYALSILRLRIINAPFPSASSYRSNVLSLVIFFVCTVGFGYVIYIMTANRDLKISQIKVTPLDALATIAGTGQLIRIYAITAGDPILVSANGEQLAFQKLRIIGGPKGAILFDGYSPQYFCLSDGKGSIYIDSSSIVELQGTSLRNDSDNNRANISAPMLEKFDKYLSKERTDNPFATVWTIKKGAHVSAAGEVIKDRDHDRYILKAPSFWHAPLLGGQLWLQSDNGVKTF